MLVAFHQEELPIPIFEWIMPIIKNPAISVCFTANACTNFDPNSGPYFESCQKMNLPRKDFWLNHVDGAFTAQCRKQQHSLDNLTGVFKMEKKRMG